MLPTAIRNLLSTLVLLGLVLAPHARLAVAAPADGRAVMSEPVAGMPSDMPCCPDAASVPDCAKACPLMALCMAGNVLNLPANVAILVPLRLASPALAGNAADLAGLMHGPPPRPPKT